jgi:hypothetical protein
VIDARGEIGAVLFYIAGFFGARALNEHLLRESEYRRKVAKGCGFN